MIYTLTLNPAVDKTAVIPNLKPGHVNRIASVREDVGGKGVNVSKCLRTLGAQSVACAFWAGETGTRAQDALRQLGIPLLSVQVRGQTRTNLKIIDPAAGENTDLNEPGPEIRPEELTQMTARLLEAVQAGDLLVLSGSVPPSVPADYYAELIRTFRARGASVFLDADGEPFRIAVRERPAFIKPNREELEQYLGRTLDSDAQIIAACRELQSIGVEEILVSLGGDGALFVGSGSCLRAEGLRVEVRSTVGAGDSMVAAMAFGRQTGMSDGDRLRLATALSAASVTHAGSDSPEPEEVRALLGRVLVHTL